MDLRTLITAISLAASITAFAETCPTNFIQEYDNHLVSHDSKILWRSADKVAHGEKVGRKDFGGALYDPKSKQLACIYHDSKRHWVAMISHSSKNTIEINKHSLDETHHVAWRFNKKANDYSCSKPYISNIKECPFNINLIHS